MKKAVVLPLCVSLLALGAVPAIAGGASEVEIKIRNSAPAFHGNVQSSESACEKQRAVFLYRVRSGLDKLLGDDQTNGQGRWEILEGEQFTLKSGIYYAQAPRLGLESGVECRRDNSRKISVD